MDSEFERVAYGADVDVDCRAVGLGELAGGGEVVGEELLADFGYAGVDEDVVEMVEVGCCLREGGSLGLPACDVALDVEEAGGGSLSSKITKAVTNPAPPTMVRNERGVYIAPSGKKTFIPLENNPAIFTELIHSLGVSPQLAFYDIYSLSDPDLLALIPKPVHALIFISPADVYHRVRETDSGTKNLTYSGSGDQEPVIWFKQTIGHACGLIALLHSVCNGSARRFITPGSTLEKLLREATPLKPLQRAEVLYNSDELEKAHMAVAFKGDSVAPLAAEPNGYHFISFVQGKDGHLYELEGSWDGPIDRGAMGLGEDVMSEKALEAGITRFVKAAEGNMEMSMIALCTKPEDD
ncbi:hypothetical protein LTR32_007349 [Rachicladosporium monterosium]|uniref:Ubiquitin carboxyl-terminal hydrolase n=1 Tax=Rachicladosporium monterosium TaxID=1507873 RepID=A0ABR0KWF0_9PEZI|nr:hypothetical protein LTR32_007349 [Rachicladosporium monterosium]